MRVDIMREWLMHNTKYSHSQNWRRKVSLMHDKQVEAVYLRFKRDGLLK